MKVVIPISDSHSTAVISVSFVISPTVFIKAHVMSSDSEYALYLLIISNL